MNGSAFNGATFYFDANRALHSIAGSEYWFREFPPVNFTGLGLMYLLLESFYSANICAHVGGTYPTYVAGVLTSFRSATIFIALKQGLWLNFIFRRREELLNSFHTGPFIFTLHSSNGEDVCRDDVVY
jgi:hypothetical protein